jgi:protein involved in polysaccharide export with SLBB domain
MDKSFAVLVFLLFVLPSHEVLGQAAPPKDQPLRTTTSQTKGAASVSTDPSPAKSLYEEGIKRVEMGQVSEAVERFQQAVMLDPEYAEAYSALGRAFFKLRQWENASSNLRRAISLKAKQRSTQNPLHNPSTTPSGSKPPTPNKNATDAKTPGVISLATNPTTKPALQSNKSAGAGTFNTKRETPQVRRLEPGTAANTAHTNDLSTVLVARNAAMNRDERDAVVPKQAPANLPIAMSVRLSALGETKITEPISLNSTTDEGDAVVPKQAPADLPIAMSVRLSAFGESKIAAAGSLKSTTDEVSLTNIYRVGPKDVLDIHLNNSQSTQPTVFTVTPSGLLEHPQLSEPLPVLGLTVGEIAAKLKNHLKTGELIDNSKVSVEVFEYASHAIVVSGLVKAPGTKMLKSEATPLLIVLAEAQPLPEAGRVTVVRNNQTQILETQLDTTDINLLVQPGDVVTVHPITTEFVYVGGRVKFPGEKTYRHRFTLVQAILAAGGEPTRSKVAEISRVDGQGSLVRTRVDLQAIKVGEAADPVLRPGDRVMILH